MSSITSVKALLFNTHLPWQWNHDIDAYEPERMWCIDDGKDIPLGDNFFQHDAILATLAVNLLGPLLEVYEAAEVFLTAPTSKNSIDNLTEATNKVKATL